MNKHASIFAALVISLGLCVIGCKRSGGDAGNGARQDTAAPGATSAGGAATSFAPGTVLTYRLSVSEELRALGVTGKGARTILGYEIAGRRWNRVDVPLSFQKALPDRQTELILKDASGRELGRSKLAIQWKPGVDMATVTHGFSFAVDTEMSRGVEVELR